MENWKRALIFGSLGVGAVLLVRGQRVGAGIAAAAGVALLASEHPDKFRDIFDNAPEYLERGNKLIGQVSDFLERVAEQGARFQGGNMGRTGTGPDYLT